jgi:DNA-binding response OmpR family regulator
MPHGESPSWHLDFQAYVCSMKVNKTSSARGPARAAAHGRATPSLRILVVDDELVIRQSVAYQLMRSGHQVDTAEDGKAAWEALQSERYDLMITDHNMPKVSGLELVKKLRAEDVALPVILMSGAMPAEELHQHPWLQLAATLHKPFTGDELLGIVERVLPSLPSAFEQIEPEIIRRSHASVHGLRA